ncbi:MULTISPECIES: hypothetical protein [Kitasatospora]|uniref:DUF4267 domain-containing protein n=1 Tax=Kitasatospora setae (strain ATCC 33774 / DSM 43861 / JCM 3304 / KCC A-0304 / NBRC 14216 / KM-6054) TaxID=452652 RepID=E4N0B2_KITSK|nr:MULTISPECIES: hypothetical protein [Kitasatospora]BAJ31440.1 hypothetical protein KSE_56670 [Kitasatospora setae KM-6054]
MDALSTANALAALAGAGSSVAGALRPGLALSADEPVTAGTHLYAWAYAARALPLGLATAVAAWADAAAAWPLLLISGLAQVGDSAIGFRRRNLGMAFGAGACAVLHLLTAWWTTR